MTDTHSVQITHKISSIVYCYKLHHFHKFMKILLQCVKHSTDKPTDKQTMQDMFLAEINILLVLPTGAVN